MAARDTVEAVSATLMDDERVLNAQEKELLAGLLQRTTIHANPADDASTAIARAAGEIVAQRASELVAGEVTRRLLESGRVISRARPQAFPPLPPAPSPPPPGPRIAVDFDQPGAQVAGRPEAFPPLPPAPSPPPPGPHIALNSAQRGIRAGARPEAFPPLPPAPSPPPPGPKGATTAPDAAASSGISELVPAQCAILENFLCAEELEALIQYALSRESAFEVSEVIAPGSSGGMIDYEHRQSRVLREGTDYPGLMERIQSVLPGLLPALGREMFAISHFEAQITASNDGDFFHWHNDNAHPDTASREITFVYFFHREPKAFAGGELRIYDCRRVNGRCQPTENYRVIVPRQNRIVFFASSLAHEITPVTCPSRAFADSRFTVNGWLHRKERRLSAIA